MTKAQLIKKIEELESKKFANRNVEFIMTNEPPKDREDKIIVILHYE